MLELLVRNEWRDPTTSYLKALPGTGHSSSGRMGDEEDEVALETAYSELCGGTCSGRSLRSFIFCRNPLQWLRETGSFSLCLTTSVVFILNISSRVCFVLGFFFFFLWRMKPWEMFLSQQPIVNCSVETLHLSSTLNHNEQAAEMMWVPCIENRHPPPPLMSVNGRPSSLA